MSRRGSSRRPDIKGGEGRLLLSALLFSLLFGFAPAGLTPLRPPLAWAQTPAGPSSTDAPQSQESTPSSPQQPSPSPGSQQQPAATPAWTPPLAPPPSQSRAPGPFVPPTDLPLGQRFQYRPTLLLSEQYTDNFNLTTSAQGKTSNFRTTLSPGSTILFNTGKTEGSVTATSGFTWDSSTSQDNFNVFPSVTASVRHTFNPRLSLTLTDSFNRTDNPNTVDSSGLQQQRETFTSNTFLGSVNWLIDLINTQYYYRNTYFTNSSISNNPNTSSQNNSTTISQIFGVGASMPVGTLNTVAVGYEYSINEPQEGVTSYGNFVTASVSRKIGTYTTVGVQGSYTTQTLDDVTIWNGSVFGTYGTPAGFSFSGSVGYSLLNSDVASNQSGFSGNALASYAHAKGVISIGVFQDYRTTYQGGQIGQTGLDQSGQNFGVVQTLGITGNFTYQFTPLVGSFIQAAYNQNRNTGIGNNKSSPNQDYFTTTAGINWLVLRWLNLSLQYNRIQYNNPDRTQNNGLLSATATF